MQAPWGNLLQAKHRMNYFPHKARKKMEFLNLQPVQEIFDGDADGNFKVALPSALDSHFIIRKNEKISKVFVTSLISDSESSTWEDETYSRCKFLTFDP